MKRLWSPWRMEYIQNSASKDECPFCSAVTSAAPADHFLVHKGEGAFVILNRYPYTTGHLLILPLEHRENLSDLDPETRAEIMEMINYALCILENIYHPEGFNIGLNIGGSSRRRDSKTSALAYCSPLGRGHQLYDRCGRGSGDAGNFAGHLSKDQNRLVENKLREIG